MPVEALAFFKAFTPGTYGIWAGVLMFAGWLLKEWRETRKLSADDRLARRDGYAKQVESLMTENRNLGEDLRKLRTDYDKYRALCNEETDQLRQQIIGLQNDVVGLMRKLAANASAELHDAANQLSPMVRAAGERAALIQSQKGETNGE